MIKKWNSRQVKALNIKLCLACVSKKFQERGGSAVHLYLVFVSLMWQWQMILRRSWHLERAMFLQRSKKCEMSDTLPHWVPFRMNDESEYSRVRPVIIPRNDFTRTAVIALAWILCSEISFAFYPKEQSSNHKTPKNISATCLCFPWAATRPQNICKREIHKVRFVADCESYVSENLISPTKRRHQR